MLEPVRELVRQLAYGLGDNARVGVTFGGLRKRTAEVVGIQRTRLVRGPCALEQVGGERRRRRGGGVEGRERELARSRLVGRTELLEELLRVRGRELRGADERAEHLVDGVIVDDGDAFLARDDRALAPRRRATPLPARTRLRASRRARPTSQPLRVSGLSGQRLAGERLPAQAPRPASGLIGSATAAIASGFEALAARARGRAAS